MKTQSTEPKYVQIAEVEGEESIEVPLEEDGTLLVTTLTAQFHNACGLKYRTPTGSMRGLRIADGKIYSPDGGWGDYVIYYGVFPKGTPKVADNKRKYDDALDEFYGPTVSKRSLGEEQVCSDLIVLGLAFSTTEEDLREYCEKFGDVIMVKVNKDTKTGKPKGFGFVKYKDYESQVKVLKQRHEINGRSCDIKVPYSNKQEVPLRSLHGQPRRFYIGRVPESLTTEDLRNYFSTFGELADVYIPRPHRDFAFVTFADSSKLNDLNGQDHIIKNASVCVQLATPKQVSAKSNQQQQGGGNQNAWANPPPPPPEMPNLQSLGLNLQPNNSIPQNVQNAFQNTVGYLSSQYANSVNVMQNYLQQQKGANSGGGNQGGYGGGSNTGGYGGGTQGYGDGNASGYGGGGTAYGTGSSMGGYGGGSAGYGGSSSALSQNVGYPPPRTNTTTGYSDSGSSIPRPPVEPCPPPTPDSRLAYHTS